MSSTAFLDREVTCREYVLRYAEDVVHCEAELLAAYGSSDGSELEDALCNQKEFDGDVLVQPDEIEMSLGIHHISLTHPFTLTELREVITDLEHEINNEEEEQ